MSLYLLDASALLAVVLGERGSEEVEALIESAGIHSFNLAEVISKLLQQGVPDPDALLSPLQLDANEVFSVEQAADCAQLHAATRGYGLSMGDCVCLSTAKRMGQIAVTAERTWEAAVAGRQVRVHCIR